MPIDSTTHGGAPEFDSHASTYDAELNYALSVSGEDKEYFAQKRVEWLAYCLRSINAMPRSAIDYGCGVGDTSDALGRAFQLDSLLGLEVSPRSLDIEIGRASCRERV